MPHVLRLTEPGVKAALRHDALKGAKKIGRGMFAAVYEKGDTILKVTCDANQYAMYRDPHHPDGPYFPVTLKDYGDIGETSDGLPIYLVEQERLDKLRGGPIEVYRAAKAVATFMGEETNRKYREMRHRGSYTMRDADMQQRASIEALESAACNKDFAPELRASMLDIAVFVANYEGVAADFGMSNMMRRGSQLILNDVVCHGPSVDRARSRFAQWHA